MTNESFKESYRTDLIKKKQEVDSLISRWEKAESELHVLQRQYSHKYQLAICKKFMNIWTKSGKFPIDEELVKVIFYIGGMDIKDNDLFDFENTDIPKTEISLKEFNFVFKYYSYKHKKWIELEP